MNFDLRETAAQHKIIVAHRGVSGGNIPCNTLTAYEIALMQGADMLETDLNITSDGKLVILHPNMEKQHLGFEGCINNMTWDEVSRLRYINYDNAPTEHGLCTFDDLLEQFKGRCYINIDKYWSNPVEIYKAVKRHNMLDQIVVKSKLNGNVLDVLEQVSPELAFMPIVSEEHPMHDELKNKNINYVGVEVLFKNEDSQLASEEFFEKMHRDNILVWVNSIVYDYNAVLSGGHSDDTAFTVSPEYGWGWLADRGFDIIQTDWPMMLIDHLKKTGKYSTSR